MSETPLTDANAAPCAEPGYQDAGCVCVSADFARGLERRLHELERAIAEMETCVFFCDGLSGDLWEAGVTTKEDAYVTGYKDALQELRSRIGKEG